ncbi:hypothetical protein V8G54_023632 [Vigna mungo]|uniref:Uncharacterized protein n=1 Tax=Vigna mungo TaxID=3915 RepID=A0AAQ3N5Q6_VIGMU
MESGQPPSSPAFSIRRRTLVFPFVGMDFRFKGFVFLDASMVVETMAVEVAGFEMVQEPVENGAEGGKPVLHEKENGKLEKDNSYFYQSRAVLNKARDLAAKKDINALDEVSQKEVEKFMAL